MRLRFIIAGAAFLLGTAILGENNIVFGAQQDANPGTGQTPAPSPPPTPTPQYDPTAAAIVGGLKGIASGAQATLGSYSDTARTKKIQAALAAAIAKGAPIKLALSDVAILCGVRESYAQTKAYADHLTSVTGAVDLLATPAQITSLGEAITSLFNKYTIDVKGNVAPAIPGATEDACIADLETWADDYYGKSKLQTTSVTLSAAAGIDGLFSDFSAFSGIIGAIINIITPIAEYAAKVHDQNERAALIDQYLGDPDPQTKAPNKNIKAVLDEAKKLVTITNASANVGRHQALGQFREKMAALREAPIDLSKLTAGIACADALKTYSGESEQIPLQTSAATAAGSTTLHFDAVPTWVKNDMKIYGTGSPNPIPSNTTVASVAGPVVITISAAAPKGGIGKGAAITFASSEEAKDKITLETDNATPADSKKLYFETAPSWIVPGVKVTATKPSVSATVVSVSLTSVVMSQGATGSGVAKESDVEFTFNTPSDAYVSCFAQAWKQINQQASDAITAAKNYDTMAQAQTSSDALTRQVDALTAMTKKPQPWPPSKLPELAQDAAQLAAFGDAMQKAFAQSNITALQNALDAAKKQLNVK